MVMTGRNFVWGCFVINTAVVLLPVVVHGAVVADPAGGPVFTLFGNNPLTAPLPDPAPSLQGYIQAAASQPRAPTPAANSPNLDHFFHFPLDQNPPVNPVAHNPPQNNYPPPPQQNLPPYSPPQNYLPPPSNNPPLPPSPNYYPPSPPQNYHHLPPPNLSLQFNQAPYFQDHQAPLDFNPPQPPYNPQAVNPPQYHFLPAPPPTTAAPLPPPPTPPPTSAADDSEVEMEDGRVVPNGPQFNPNYFQPPASPTDHWFSGNVIPDPRQSSGPMAGGKVHHLPPATSNGGVGLLEMVSAQRRRQHNPNLYNNNNNNNPNNNYNNQLAGLFALSSLF